MLTVSDDVDDDPPRQDIVVYAGAPPEVTVAYRAYLDLGPTRSTLLLSQKYSAMRRKDPYAAVPTDDEEILSRWETQYNWKARAWEYDAESNKAYLRNRHAQLEKLYAHQMDQSDKMLELAVRAFDHMLKYEDNRLNPEQALAYANAGLKLRQQATEGKLRIEDPKEQGASAGDVFDMVRQLTILQFNNSTIVQQGP